MAKISMPLALFAAACLAGALAGCKTVRGPEGEKALWSTVDGSAATKKDLKDPSKLNLAYARWQEQLGQLGDARQYYQLAVQDDPKSVEAILGIARLDQLAGREQQAEEGMQKALQIKPNDPFVQHSVGQFYASKNQWQKAGDLLSRAMMAEPENVLYRYDFAVALGRMGRPDQAMPHFVKSVGEAEAHFNVAYILFQQGNLPLAEQHLLQSISKRPDLKPAQNLLAEVRGMTKDRSTIAGASPASNGVSQASLTVPPGTGPVRVQQTQGRGRLVMNPQRQPTTPSPQVAAQPATPPGNDRPATQSGGRTPANYQQVEQWNKQTGVW